MIQFEQTVRQGAPMTIVEIVGGNDPIYAGRIYRGDSGQFFVEPSRATQDQICEGVFGTREAAEKYVAKCLKGADMQTTEADVTVERAKARREAKARAVTPAPKPVSKPRKRATTAADTQGCEGLSELLVIPSEPKPTTRKRKETLGEKIEEIAETAEREKVGRITRLKKDGKVVGLEDENGTVVVLEDAITEKPTTCSVDGCANKPREGALCRKHADAARTENPDAPRCSLDGCEAAAAVKGMCRTHYRAGRRAEKKIAA